MKRSYTRYNTLNEDARRQQLRSNLRNSNRIVEDEDEEELDDIEIEADAVDSGVDGADEDFKQKLIDLFNQAVDAGILTIEDLTGEAEGDEDEETSEDDFGEDDLEESSRRASARARKVNEAKRRILARRSVSNPRFVESARRRIARPASNHR